MSETPRVVTDPAYGHRRLDPAPRAAELERFYRSRYYHLIRKGERDAGLARLLRGGPEAAAEREWLERTLFGDIAETLAAAAPGPRVLDVGCGTGDLVAALGAAGFEAVGLEPSLEAVEVGRERGLRLRTESLAELAAAGERFDAVTLINVLEHVPDPAGLLTEVHAVLEPGGVLCVQVPNDFNRLQTLAQRSLGRAPWWIAVPDHVSYFDFRSLDLFLRGHGFAPFDAQGDFPMEVFLLGGQDYVGDPEVGAACHRRRVELELGVPREERRALYRDLARGGIGRNALVFARATPGPRVAMERLDRRREGYRYVALRGEDTEILRQWRNAQIPVLRQNHPISPEEQQRWYREVVQPTHASPAPEFLLVSILDSDDRFVGYGGLTYIRWPDRRAEVSFLVDPQRAADPETYARDTLAFLAFLEDWAFGELGLERLFHETYAFRTDHLALLERAGYVCEGRLRAHVRKNGERVDSVIHAKLRPEAGDPGSRSGGPGQPGPPSAA